MPGETDTTNLTPTTEMTPTAPTSDAPAAQPDGGADDATILGGDEPAAPAQEGGDPPAAPEGDDKPSLTGAPEKYEFTMPDGVNFDTEAFEAVEPVLRELDLSQDAAGKLIGAYAEKVLPALQARADAQADQAGAELRADWARQTQADTEIGGPKLEESKALAAKAMARFAGQGAEAQPFRTFLNESGLGNHPEMVRLMARVGRALGEASVDQGVAPGAAPKTAEQIFYGRS